MPGTDGFPAEFYRFFWPEISKEMTDSFNYVFQSGTLSITQRRGAISLIPKKPKDKRSLENLRPISLLNVDYKILTKTIAKRIEKVLPNIINVDQTGYVKGRYIGENIRLIQDVLHFTNLTKQKGIAIFLDFKKAFDSIEWPYLNAALELFNFGPDILSWTLIVVVEYWQYFKMLSINETDIKDEVLWNNRNTLIDKKPVFYRNWFSKNIIHLHHLLNDHGKFYAFDEFKPNIT